MTKLRQSTLDNLGSFETGEQRKELNLAFLRRKNGSFDADLEFYSQRIIDVAKKGKYDILVDFYNSLYTDINILSAEEKDSIVKKIAQETRDIDSLIILGTTLFKKDGNLFSSNPIIYKGNSLEYFRKKIGTDWFRVASKNGLNPVKGKQGNVLNWKGWRIGFENCKDIGELKRYLLQSGQAPVDLQLISAYNYLNMGGPSVEDIAARDKGYVLMYDSFRDKNGIFAYKIDKTSFLYEPVKMREISEKFDKECNGISFRIKNN